MGGNMIVQKSEYLGVPYEIANVVAHWRTFW
jgi:hypothetical protein